MRLSTSSSEVPVPGADAGAKQGRRYLRAAVGLIASIAVFLIGVELVTLFGFSRVSRIQKRISEEYRAAITARKGPEPELLLAGNSLMEAGIQFPDLQRGLGPEWKSKRFVVEQTSYPDWYYGFRRIYSDGGRPTVTALMVSPRHLTNTTIRGDFFARHLMQLTDLPSVARDLDLHPTTTTSMILANVSEFYGARAEIRKWLLAQLLPGLPGLTGLLAKVSNAPLDPVKVHALSVERFRVLKEEASHYGSQFVFVVTPLRGDEEIVGVVQRAGKEAGVTVINVDSRAFSSSDYSDGFHLNPKGAEKLTRLITPVFRSELSRLAPKTL